VGTFFTTVLLAAARFRGGRFGAAARFAALTLAFVAARFTTAFVETGGALAAALASVRCQH
jgi:hypothetical protein